MADRSYGDQVIEVRPWRTALILALLAMIGPMSVDAIFPAFPLIAAHFGTDRTYLQQLVSVYLLTYGIGSLFHGPMSDVMGRKPVIILSLTLYSVASGCVALAGTFTEVLICRAIQGLCAGAGFVVARAMVRDTFEGSEAQRMVGTVMFIYGISPAIAPIGGAAILPSMGWAGSFVILSIYAAVLAGTVWLGLAESLPCDRRVRFNAKALVLSYAGLLRDRRFIGLASAGAFNYSGIFLLIASSPVIVLRDLGLSANGFPAFYVPLVAGMMGGAWLSRYGAKAGRADRAVKWGYFLMFSAATANCLVTSFHDRLVPWFLFALLVQGAGVQLAFPSITVGLLDRCPHALGLGSSLQAFGALILNAAVAGVVSPLLSGSLIWLVVGSFCLTLLGWLSWRLVVIRAQEVGLPIDKTLQVGSTQ
jgi:DHA1 family bicyclomycin/chloramphenicol resistance-like MFS transporter